MRAIFCPRCNSTDIHPYVGGMAGAYRCNACGYLGPLVLEQSFIKKMKRGR